MLARDRVAVGALVLAAAVLRLATIDLQSYWFDEALTAEILRRDLGGVLDGVHDTQLTPPLYYVVAWAWTQLFGVGEIGLRSLSAVAGIALVPVAYACGVELGSRRTGLIAAALTAFNPLLVWYSQEARPYSLLVLLAALSFLLFLRLLRTPDRRLLALWAAVSALALLTHYFAVFVILPELLLLLSRQASLRRAVLVAGAAVGAVGLALVPLADFQAGNIGTGYITSYRLVDRIWWLARDSLAGVPVHPEAQRDLEEALAVAGLAVLAVSLALAARKLGPEERQAALLPAAVGLGALALAAVLAVAGLDYLNTRNMIVVLFPLTLAVAALLGSSGARVPAVAATVAVCAVGVAAVMHVFLEPRLQRADWRALAETLGPARQPRLLAVPPVDGEVSLGFYLPAAERLDAAGASVREVDLVAVNTPGTPTYFTGPPARPRPPGNAFRPTASTVEESHLAFRFEAARPSRVRAAALNGRAPYLDRPTVLIEHP
jgi:mannosyltransferase